MRCMVLHLVELMTAMMLKCRSQMSPRCANSRGRGANLDKRSVQCQILPRSAAHDAVRRKRSMPTIANRMACMGARACASRVAAVDSKSDVRKTPYWRQNGASGLTIGYWPGEHRTLIASERSTSASGCSIVRSGARLLVPTLGLTVRLSERTTIVTGPGRKRRWFSGSVAAPFTNVMGASAASVDSPSPSVPCISITSSPSSVAALMSRRTFR